MKEDNVIRLEGKLGRVSKYDGRYYLIFNIGQEGEERVGLRLEVNESVFERYKRLLEESGKELNVYGRLEIYLENKVP